MLSSLESRVKLESFKTTLTRLFFGHLGFYYDWLMTARHEETLRRDFLDFVGPGRDDLVIEFGCGSGNVTELAARRCVRVDGLDSSAEMLKRARRRLTRAKVGNFDLIHSRVESFEPIERYDWAVAVAFVYLFHDPEEVIQRMAASVRPGGGVATMDPSSDFTRANVDTFIRENRLTLKDRYILRDWLRAVEFYRRFTEPELEASYLAAGLKDIQSERRLRGMVIFAKGTRSSSSGDSGKMPLGFQVTKDR